MSSQLKYIFFRIVQAFDNIVDSLIELDNFTNISVVEQDLALRGERVSHNTYDEITSDISCSDQ